MRAPVCSLVLVIFLTACGGNNESAIVRATQIAADPHYDPPRLQVTHAAENTAPGLVFIAQKGGKGKRGGPLIVDDQGRIRWYHKLDRPLEATDFRTQMYRGKPVLTWWEGRISKSGVGVGHYVVYSSSYERVATVTAKHGLAGDLHEFELTPRDTALITIYKEVRADLGAVGGPKRGWALDSIVQELDLASGRVVFEWHSIGHVPFSESMQAHREPALHASKKRPFDYFHANSAADAPGGNILISARNASSLYLVARDGHIVWRLGGKHSDFGPPAAVKFAFQHHARLPARNLLTLFDNGAIPKVEPFSRALVLRLDLATRRATIVKSFVHPKKLLSPYEGDFQLLPDGGAFVGWGGVRRVTEFAPGGGIRFELKLPYGDTYRAFRLPWAGRPAEPPIASVRGNTVSASWNGSTDVEAWDVLAGDDDEHLSKVGHASWAGLETVIPLETSANVVAVRAIGSAGHELATSAAVDR